VDLHLEDQVALVAGSSRGIGLATARAVLAEGCRTVITGRDPERLEGARASLVAESGAERVLAFAGDVCDPAAIGTILESIQDAWGRLDCLVANVGTGRGPTGWQVPEADWSRLIDENLSCTYRVVQAVLPLMIGAGRGSIVMVASIAGLESTGAPLPYGAAKAALVHFSGGLAREVGPSNVRINAVAPGNILFPGGSWERHLAQRRDDVLRQIDAEVPLRRFGRPEEIADLIVYLSSDRAAFITGSCVVADGGQTRGR
jgi:3-oxoacyl-[acyl-carrier protein] reductase